MPDSVLRRLARDQWVRLHGTPRVTVLVGGDRGREIWQQWTALSGREGPLLERRSRENQDDRGEREALERRSRENQDDRGEREALERRSRENQDDRGEREALDGEFDARVREAVARALRDPAQPIAVLVAADAASRWRTGRSDRLAAMVDEGWTVVPEPPAELRGRSAQLDARSAAEATLHEALEATPATSGRFALNESLSVRFGPKAAEIDLLSRGDRIAVEIDGVHHFADPDCYRRDRRKDLLLQTQGFVVVRLLAEDVMRDVRTSVNAVCQALAYRREESAR